ncbi:unnamed protein product [Amoebophrya sp. A25]|nr:unnamed protein product [Amoebophrya sp. A25]|eukprot:GSA25T00023118001.1
MADYMTRGDPRKRTRRVPTERRRLTLGVVDKKESLQQSRVPQESGNLINYLKTQNVSDIVKAGKRKLTLSSVTAERQESFDEKPTTGQSSSTSSAGAAPVARRDVQAQTREELNRLGIGATCRKGLKPESPNQDAFSVVYVSDEFLLTGVYDGHGAHGHHISQFVKENLPKIFLNDPQRQKDPASALTDAFGRCQRLIEHAEKTGSLQAGMSGTTCTLVYQPLTREKAGTIYIAHVGDSRATMISRSRGSWGGRGLTEDHKPSLAKEKARIEERGGRVLFDGFFNHRVFAKGQMYPGLNMSRAFGDCVAHREAGLCADPDVTQIRLQDDDIGMLICSDGVWEFVDGARASNCVMQKMQQDGNNPQRSVEELAKLSWSLWMEDSDNEISDDITGVLVMFDKLRAGAGQ